MVKEKLEKAERRRVREETKAAKVAEKAALEAERLAKLEISRKNMKKVVKLNSDDDDHE